MPKTALLVMDVQAGIMSRLPNAQPYLALLSRTLAAARPFVQIIHVTTSFRAGHPEIAASNKTFSAIVKSNAFVSGSPETAIDPAVAPHDGDIVVEKKRVSAFSGSGLDVVLRGLGVETLVLAGVSTGGVVLSTVCEAADRDFGIIVLRDGCLDGSVALHDMLMDGVFGKRGEVVSAEQWLGRLKD